MSSRRVVGQITNAASGNLRNPSSENFDGDGVETEFTIANTGTIYLVEVGGQIMRPNVDYVINDDTVIFTVAPAAGVEVGVYFFARYRQSSVFSADNDVLTADSGLITADAI